MPGWDPFAEGLGNVDRLGGRFRHWHQEESGDAAAGTHQPRADQYEDDGHLTIEVELPGVSPIDVSVQISGEQVVVEAERRFVRNGRQVRQLESNYGRMRREFQLPVRARPEAIVAELRHGFLRITVPRRPAEVFHDKTIVPLENEGAQAVDVL